MATKQFAVLLLVTVVSLLIVNGNVADAAPVRYPLDGPYYWYGDVYISPYGGDYPMAYPPPLYPYPVPYDPVPYDPVGYYPVLDPMPAYPWFPY